jgi:hypothetical protein
MGANRLKLAPQWARSVRGIIGRWNWAVRGTDGAEPPRWLTRIKTQTRTLAAVLPAGRPALLFGCACYRAIWPQLRVANSRAAIDVAERAADGRATEQEIEAIMCTFFMTKEDFEDRANRICLTRDGDRVLSLLGSASKFVRDRTSDHRSAMFMALEARREWPTTCAVPRLIELQSRILAVMVAPGWAWRPHWRTDTAVALARAMYEARDFSAMPILADALQDAGCDNAEWLARMRDREWRWFRGCRVVADLLGSDPNSRAGFGGKERAAPGGRAQSPRSPHRAGRRAREH